MKALRILLWTGYLFVMVALWAFIYFDPVGRARARAHSNVCLYNLSKMGDGFHLYQERYGCLPPDLPSLLSVSPLEKDYFVCWDAVVSVTTCSSNMLYRSADGSNALAIATYVYVVSSNDVGVRVMCPYEHNGAYNVLDCRGQTRRLLEASIKRLYGEVQGKGLLIPTGTCVEVVLPKSWREMSTNMMH